MASLRKRIGSPYWVACYYDKRGKRVQHSTEQTNRKTAQAVADKLEKAAKQAAEKRLTKAKATRLLNEMLAEAGEETIQTINTRDFLTRWVDTRKADTSPSTHAAYSQVAREFIESLGTRADLDIDQISKPDVARYRTGILRRTSPATANKSLKILRVALDVARKDGYMPTNPAADLDTLKRTAADRNERRPFTVKEARLVVEHAQGEWRGIALFGLYTGQRLGDIARLTWNNLDLERGELRLVTKKTGNRLNNPIPAPLLSYITDSLDAGDNPAAPLFPKAAATIAKSKSDTVGTLSKQFHDILVSAGLAKPHAKKSHHKQAANEKRTTRRTVGELSFHSFRHTYVSLLKNAGVPEAVAMELAGHDSKAVSQNYTHIGEDALRSAVDKMPDVLASTPSNAKQSMPKAAKQTGRS